MAKKPTTPVMDITAKLAAIDAKAAAEKGAIADEIKAAMDGKREEIKVLEDEYEKLAESYASATGRAIRKATVGGGKRTRISDDDKNSALAKLATIKGKQSKGDICSAIGIDKKSWGTIKKLAGNKLKQHGEKKNATYSWEG